MYTAALGSGACLILQLVYSYIPLYTLPSAVKVYVNFGGCHILFTFESFYSVAFSLAYHLPPSFFLSSRSSLTFLGRFSYHLFCPCMALCLFFCYSTQQSDDNIYLRILPPLIDCGLGLGPRLCFIHFLASEPRNTISVLFKTTGSNFI